MTENLKSQGTKSLGACMASLMKFGKTILMPIGDNERYDLVLEENGKFERIQAKTGRLRNGAVKFSPSSTNYVKGKWRKNIYVGQIEAFVVYCPDNDKTYLVPIEHVGNQKDVSLRIDPAKNNQKALVRWASDYEL